MQVGKPLLLTAGYQFREEQGDAVGEGAEYRAEFAADHASALALDEDDYKTLSHVLAVGLPAVAGGISLARDDTPGLYQLAKSEAFTFAATELLKLTV